jgi:hypothetical protein
LIEQVAIRDDRPIHLLAREDDQPERHAPGAPSQPPGSVDRVPFVPSHLTLEPAQVLEPALDLHDNQRLRGRTEREQVHPAAHATRLDRDLASDLPAARAEPSRDVSRAPGVDRVLPLRLAEERRLINDQLETLAERPRDPVHQVFGHVRPPSLDIRQVAAVNAERLGELLLGQIQAESPPATGGSERLSDRHVCIEPGGPSLALTALSKRELVTNVQGSAPMATSVVGFGAGRRSLISRSRSWRAGADSPDRGRARGARREAGSRVAH